MTGENSFSAVQKYFFLGLLAAVTIIFVWLLKSYLITILWAVVFAILLFPIFKDAKKIFKNASISAVLSILLALVGVFLPLVFVGILLAEDAVSIYQDAAVSAPAYIDALSGNSYVEDGLNLFGINISEVEAKIVDYARAGSAWIATQIFSFGARTFSAVVKFFIMLYLLFFFLKDGERILERLGRTVSLGGGRERALFERFSLTVSAMFKGTIVIAIIQGLLGGILFWALGIENAVLWGSLMAFLSIIPAVGPSFIWIPAAAIYLALGSPGIALALVIGGVAISLADNLLKPVLVGRSTQMPDALILISIFGGIVTFGITGVILGPVIAALFLSLWAFFADEYKAELVGGN